MATKLTADGLSSRSWRLTQLCDRIAERLGVDPERIMFDAPNNQVRIPAALAEQLLSIVEG